MTHTIAERLARFSSELRYEDIPGEVVEKAKRLVLDTIGVCVGSTQIDFGASAIKLVSAWGGAPQASLVGAAAKVPVHHAAFCNGVLGHGQDYDDTHTESVVHPSAALVPVALAAGEAVGASGKDVLSALVAGLEATIRIGMPALNRFHLRGFHTTSIAATFGAALVTARLTGTDLARTIDAVGVGGSFTSGLLECIPAASGAKRLHAGWSGLCGVVAAQMAEVGFSGPSTVFEGKLGVYNSFLRGEALDLDVIFDGLGEHWETLDVRPKLYPCCHYLQAFLDCAAVLRQEYAIDPSNVERIDCRVAPGAVNIVCEPWQKKLEPVTGYDTRFSLPFAVAVMLAEGKAGVQEFAPESIANPVVKALMPLVRYEADAKYEVKDMPAWIELTLADGRRLVHEVAQVRGDARNPVPLSELMRKFHATTECLDAAESHRMAEHILGLEQAADLSALASCMRSAGIRT